jgi:uncharacterized protein
MENQPAATRKALVLTIGCLLVTSLFFIWSYIHTDQYQSDTINIKIGEKTYTTEVSRTEEARAKGLSGRAALCATCAMLFVFDTPSQYGFWMKDMQFAIDILWLRDGTIVHKESNVSPAVQNVMKPSVEADSVLEILPNDSIRVGDSIELAK